MGMSFLNQATAVSTEPEASRQLPASEVSRGLPETIDLDQMVVDVAAEVIRREGEEERAELDGPAGFAAPAWEIGPQRYGDPELWRPDTPTALTQDEEYGELYRVVQQIDQA